MQEIRNVFKLSIGTYVILLCCLDCLGQKVIPLYDGKIPHALPCSVQEYIPKKGRVAGVTFPSLTIFEPPIKDSFRSAVIILPGGGYSRLAIQHEGYDIALELSKRGVWAFVVKYRLPIDSSCTDDRAEVAIIDAQQAIKLVRENAGNWGINPSKIGVLGLSAGGHLATTLGTRFDNSLIENFKKTSLRPDFLMLGYPVISFSDSLGHSGSRKNMLGQIISEQQKLYYSNELHVTENTPPAFIFHAANDENVSVMNSVAFFSAMKKKGIPVEMHIVQMGGHGFGLNDTEETFDWIRLAFQWLATNHFVVHP